MNEPPEPEAEPKPEPKPAPKPGPPHQHVITRAEAGQTLLAIVRAMMTLPWSRAEALVTTRRVMVDGVVAPDPARRMAVAQVVVVSDQQMKVTRGMLEPERVAYVDADVLVVRKPAGIMTVPFHEDDRDTLIDRASVWVRRVHGGDGELGAVQRLDKDTSGLVVFTRGFAAKSALARQFDAHTILRRYEALVYGQAVAKTHESWLVKNRGDGLRGSWRPVLKPGSRSGPPSPPKDAQRAVTHVDVLEPLPGATRVECRLETGRTHQIRIHLAEAKTPIIGDEVYIRNYRGPRVDAPRQMLHAAELGFAHPRDGRPMRFEDPLPADFLAVLAALRKGAAKEP